MSDTHEVPEVPDFDWLDAADVFRTFTDGRFETRFNGIRTWKLEQDLTRYATILTATRPDVLIETGSRYGGSAHWFAEFCDVISVDFDPAIAEENREHERITWITADSASTAVADQLAEMVAGRRVMVSLDAEHAYSHVRQEIRNLGPLVTSGCYLVVEDGIFDLTLQPRLQRIGGERIPIEGGPLRAIREELFDRPEWIRDTLVERQSPLTYHPAGWWLRA